MGKAMELPTGYKLENVWEGKTPELQAEIIDYWIANGALGARDEAEKRVDQVIFLVRDGGGQLAAVSTVFRLFNRQLSNWFYYFRCFVGEAHRRLHLATHMIVATRDFLNQRFLEGEQQNTIGILVVVENEFLKRERNHAVWPHSQFVYIGQSKNGDHIRVFYFDGARIS